MTLTSKSFLNYSLHLEVHIPVTFSESFRHYRLSIWGVRLTVREICLFQTHLFQTSRAATTTSSSSSTTTTTTTTTTTKAAAATLAAVSCYKTRRCSSNSIKLIGAAVFSTTCAVGAQYQFTKILAGAITDHFWVAVPVPRTLLCPLYTLYSHMSARCEKFCFLATLEVVFSFVQRSCMGLLCLDKGTERIFWLWIREISSLLSHELIFELKTNTSNKIKPCFRAGIAERVSALDCLSLRCAAIITLHVRTPACAFKQGTLPHLLHLWTEM